MYQNFKHRAYFRSAGLLALLIVASTATAQEKSPLFYGVQFEQLEYRWGNDTDVLAWDGDALVGTDDLKLRFQSEGEYSIKESAFETLESQILVQRPISSFFDVKAGVRIDNPRGSDRVYGVLGVQGLAPQWFEVDADLFLSNKSDFSARLDVEYELLITNRIILTPSAEVNFAFSEDRDIMVGSGLGKTELGVRLSYDLVDRSIAPYIGIHYERLFGSTKKLARAENESDDEFFIVAGVRVRF